MVKIEHVKVGKIRIVYGTHLHLCVDFYLAYLTVEPSCTIAKVMAPYTKCY